MSGEIIRSPSEQVAAHLRDELRREHWRGTMPGVPHLAKELGIDHKTVEAALRLLERDGLLVAQGPGRRRLIALEEKPMRTALSVRILLFERIDQGLREYVDLLHRLRLKGHVAEFANQSLHDLGMNVKRVAAHVKAEGADAWIVCAGSRAILEWFATQATPAFAQFGKLAGLPIPGIRVEKIPAIKTMVRRLHGYGHRRMVLMTRQNRLKGHLRPNDQAFFDELDALGIATGPYNMPYWEDDIAGFHRCLDSLFQHTPPTALFLDEARLFIAAQQHLARLGKITPRDVSMICGDPDIAFSWCDPPVSHIRWDCKPVVNRMVQWVDNLARGKEDRRQRSTLAEFVEGGTIGPVPAR